MKTNSFDSGKQYLRCHELQSIDLTGKPAANPDGLFSMNKEIKYESGTSGKHSKDCLCGECESKGKEKSMEQISTEIANLASIVNGLVTKLDAKPVVGSLTAKDKDGKEIQLSATDIITRLDAADKFVADARKSVEDSQRREIIGQLSAQGRVVFNPETNVAYKLEELEKLDLPLLKFAARNSQVIPTQARAVFTATGKETQSLTGPDGKRLTGTALTTKAWEADYGNLDKMLEAPMGQTN